MTSHLRVDRHEHVATVSLLGPTIVPDLFNEVRAVLVSLPRMWPTVTTIRGAAPAGNQPSIISLPDPPRRR